MSASDEEAFESAEDDETQKGAKAATEKSPPKGEPNKSPPSAGGGKGGGKPKGKQQQQQRKTKGEQAKPAADKKQEKSAPKNPAGEKLKTAPSSGARDSKPNSEETTAHKQEIEPDKAAAKSSLEKSPVTSTDSNISKQGSVAEKDSNKETSEDRKKKTLENKKTPEKVQDKDKPEKTAESQGKTAGEIRQNLSSKTEDSTVKNPADQSIPRDSGDTGGGSAEDRKGQEASKNTAKADGGGGWNWGWGSSLLNAATSSLETFSSQVGEGLSTIIDSVESSFGVPDPQDLAQADAAMEPDSKPEGAQTVTVQPHEKEGSEEPHPETEKAEGKVKGEKVTQEAGGATAKESKETAQQDSGWLSSWGMSSLTDMGKSLVNKSQTLMNTGFEKAETLAAGGLDILEAIGKKTYTTLTDHDPGLRRAREFLQLQEKPSLSSVLREVQNMAEQQARYSQEMEEARKISFADLFEDNQGLAHLEALEMLSNQSERKVQSLLSAMDDDRLQAIRPQLLDIKQVFQTACDRNQDTEQAEETEHDFSKLVTENLSELHLGSVPDKLNKVQETVRQWIADFYSHEDHNEISDPKDVHQRAIQSLADVTSKAVEQFHKAGEIILMHKDEDSSCTHRAQNLAKLCSVLITEVDILANKFSLCLNRLGEETSNMEEVSPMVTSVFLEASNASSYILDAFQLLLPVLQHAALQSVL